MRKLFTLACCMSLIWGIQAQNFNGKVVDETNQSVPFANVVQMSQDSVFLNGCVTNENGAFQMDKAQNAAKAGSSIMFSPVPHFRCKSTRCNSWQVIPRRPAARRTVTCATSWNTSTVSRCRPEIRCWSLG